MRRQNTLKDINMKTEVKQKILRLVSIKEIEFLIKNLPSRNIQAQITSLMNFNNI